MRRLGLGVVVGGGRLCWGGVCGGRGRLCWGSVCGELASAVGGRASGGRGLGSEYIGVKSAFLGALIVQNNCVEIQNVSAKIKC